MLLLVAFGMGIYRLSAWARWKSSERTKDGLILALLVTFAAGMFFCFPVGLAFTLSAAAAVSVAADFLERKGGCSVVTQRYPARIVGTGFRLLALRAT